MHEGWRSYPRLGFRILFSLIFIVAGAGHLRAPDALVARLATAPGAFLVDALPPRTLILLSGVALLAGGVALLLGLFTRWAAAGLALVLVPITLTVQVGNAEGLGPLFKNVALLGGLLHWMVEGGGAFALDQLLTRRPKGRAVTMGVVAMLVVLAAAPAVALAAAPAAAASKESPKERVFFLVQQVPQAKAALATASAALAGHGFPARAAEVLVCGPAVKALVDGGPLAAPVREAHAAGVRVVACGLSLRELGMEAAALADHVEVVENGFVEALQRQAEGFRSVQL